MSKSRFHAGCAVALFGLAVGAPAQASKAEPVVGVTVYEMTSFVSLAKQGAQAVADANHAKLLWQSANNDVNAQVSQIQQFVNQKVDVIVVAAVNSSTLAPQISAAKQAGIPVVAVNMMLKGPAAGEIASYVGADDVKAGEQVAQQVVDAVSGKGSVVVLQGPLGQSGEIDRTQGIRNVLAKSPGIKLLAMQPASWDRNKAYSLMQDWLSRYGSQIAGVIAENDDMAIGAVRALKERGLAGKIPVTGVDGIKDGLRAVRSGDMAGTNLQNAPLEFGEAIQVAIDHVQGRPVPKQAMLVMPKVGKADAGKYYQQLYGDADGFIKGLPALVKKNLASGDYAAQ